MLGVSGVLGRPRTANVLALTWMNVQVLTSEDWLRMGKAYPQEMAILTSRVKRRINTLQTTGPNHFVDENDLERTDEQTKSPAQQWRSAAARAAHAAGAFRTSKVQQGQKRPSWLGANPLHGGGAGSRPKTTGAEGDPEEAAAGAGRRTTLEINEEDI